VLRLLQQHADVLLLLNYIQAGGYQTPAHFPLKTPPRFCNRGGVLLSSEHTDYLSDMARTRANPSGLRMQAQQRRVIQVGV